MPSTTTFVVVRVVDGEAASVYGPFAGRRAATRFITTETPHLEPGTTLETKALQDAKAPTRDRMWRDTGRQARELRDTRDEVTS